MEICQTLQSRVAASSPRLDSRAADSIKVKGRRLPPLTGEWREGNGALIDRAPGDLLLYSLIGKAFSRTACRRTCSYGIMGSYCIGDAEGVETERTNRGRNGRDDERGGKLVRGEQMPHVWRRGGL